MLSLSEDNQSDIIEAFNNSNSRYLDNLLNIENNFFDSMGGENDSPQLKKKLKKVGRVPKPFTSYKYVKALITDKY